MRKVIIIACLTSLLSCMALPSFAIDTISIPENSNAFTYLNGQKINAAVNIAYFDSNDELKYQNIYNGTYTQNGDLIIKFPHAIIQNGTNIGARYLTIYFFFDDSNYVSEKPDIASYDLLIDNYTIDYNIKVDNKELFEKTYPNVTSLLNQVTTVSYYYKDNITTADNTIINKEINGTISNTPTNKRGHIIQMSLFLFNWPGHVLYLGDYTVTISRFLINNTDLYFESELKESNDITQSMDTKLDNLTQSITVPEPNYNNINKSYDNAFNNIDTVATSTLFNWTSNPLVITILTMVASFGVLSYILFGKKG